MSGGGCGRRVVCASRWAFWRRYQGVQVGSRYQRVDASALGIVTASDSVRSSADDLTAKTRCERRWCFHSTLIHDTLQ